ncbi:hypothetical protein ACLMJK_002816 [Lecanora helva]
MSGASGTNFNVMSDLVASNTALIDCLRDIPVKKLMDVSVSLARRLRPPFGELAFYPSYDGDYIPSRPSLLLRKGAFVKGIPIIASWVANDGAWYAQPSLTDDASVLASFQTFILGLSKASLDRILSLYPLSDFTHLVRPNEEATAQYYRAAQISRDLWFTCPVIDFTWQYKRYGTSNVRLYEMNQTKFGPILQYMGVPQWRVCHLSDIPYILNEDVAAGGDNSPAQRELSSLLSGSAAAFAYTGDPTSTRGQSFKNWPFAYSTSSKQALSSNYPQDMSLYVIGGPEGSGSADVGPQGSSIKGSRSQALAGDKLIERCNFINSIQDEIGV